MWMIRPALSFCLTAMTYGGILLSFSLVPHSFLLALIVFLITMGIARENDAEAGEVIVSLCLFCMLGYWALQGFELLKSFAA